MSRLDDLYKAMETLRKEGLPVDENLEKKANELEEEIIKKEILPFCKVPVISNRRDAKYGKSQKDLGDGWLLITHNNNLMKKDFIEKIPEVLTMTTFTNHTVVLSRCYNNKGRLFYILYAYKVIVSANRYHQRKEYNRKWMDNYNNSRLHLCIWYVSHIRKT